MVARANERHDWIAERSPGRAGKWYRGLFEKIETLKTHPKRCPVAPESEDYGEQLRYLIYGKRGDDFRILFTIRGDGAIVIRKVGKKATSFASSSRSGATSSGSSPCTMRPRVRMSFDPVLPFE